MTKTEIEREVTRIARARVEDGLELQQTLADAHDALVSCYRHGRISGLTSALGVLDAAVAKGGHSGVSEVSNSVGDRERYDPEALAGRTAALPGERETAEEGSVKRWLKNIAGAACVVWIWAVFLMLGN